MSLTALKKSLKTKNIQTIFTDYYDTIIHRTVHPNYALRLWAKFLIKECGLIASIDEVYFVRTATNKYLSEKFKTDVLEVPYTVLKEENYRRLVNQNILQGFSKSEFFEVFEKADLKAETQVQYLNDGVVQLLKDFKAEGGRVYLVSDFYGSKSLFESLLSHHGILEIFDGVFSSADMELSKANGSIFEPLLDKLSLQPKEVMMIGDNKVSDYENSQKHGLHAFQLPHGKHLRRNKLNNLGNDFRAFKNTIEDIHSECTKSSVMPFVEYIIFYHFFTERLYDQCKRNSVKNLFFLSREGMYLKKLFDAYQAYHQLDDSLAIKTHYLKISRQASMQINLKELEKEEFKYLKEKYPAMSLEDFLSFFSCPESDKETIGKELNADSATVLEGFFDSQLFQNLLDNPSFKTFYKNHRTSNKKDFEAYMNSFGTDYKKEGIHLVDIGWGGTMQESIFGFLNEDVPVTGYYLGIRDIYNLQEATKRSGLLFSLLPYTDYNDHILMANTQFYEQFSAANHGSALGYTSEENGFVLEKHNPQEKWLYDTYIEQHQQQMFDIHLEMIKRLSPICYDQNMVQKALSELALKTGLFVNSRKLKFVQELNSGFFQNIGTNKVGLEYKKEKGTGVLGYLKTFIMKPEVLFRYVVKLKPVLYGKNKVLAFFTPVYFIYLYYKFNKFVRYSMLRHSFLLKSNYFRTDKTQ